jgi:hypothetical protein
MRTLLAIFFGTLLLALASIEVEANRSDNGFVVQIQSEFDREFPLVLAELHERTTRTIDDFQLEAKSSVPNTAHKLAKSIAEFFDGYSARIKNKNKPDDLYAAMEKIVREETDREFRPMFDATAEQLIRDEVWARSRLLLTDNNAWQQDLRTTYSLQLDGLRSTSFFRDLTSPDMLTFKGMDDGVSLIPWVGIAYEASKFVYDSRLENLIVQPADKFFTPILKKSVSEAGARFSSRYENRRKLGSILKTDWSASKALSYVQGQRQ